MGIKYNVNEDFFKKWSFKMAYVLGYLYADGSLEDASYIRGKYTRVSSTEKTNITRIRKWLKSEHTVVKNSFIDENRKDLYLLRIGSHELYNDLVELGLFPNKSLTMKVPSIPNEYFSSFLLGYFDGDGCVTLRRERNKKKTLTVKGLRVIFTCGSEKFLISLAKKIKENTGTTQLNVYNGCRSFMLCYSTRDSVKIFKFFYNLKQPGFSQRKFDIFCNYFTLRPKWVDGEMKEIIKTFSTGRVAK